MTSRLVALLLTILAGILITLGAALIFMPAGLITAGVLLLAGLFGPDVE